MILPLNSIMELKRKCKSDIEAKKIGKVMPLDGKIKILDNLSGEHSSSWPNILLTFYFEV
jgi:hypothetical protein